MLPIRRSRLLLTSHRQGLTSRCGRKVRRRHAASQEGEGSGTFLPEDILGRIFAGLEPATVVRCAATCRRHRQRRGYNLPHSAAASWPPSSRPCHRLLPPGERRAHCAQQEAHIHGGAVLRPYGVWPSTLWSPAVLSRLGRWWPRRRRDPRLLPPRRLSQRASGPRAPARGVRGWPQAVRLQPHDRGHHHAPAAFRRGHADGILRTPVHCSPVRTSSSDTRVRGSPSLGCSSCTTDAASRRFAATPPTPAAGAGRRGSPAA